MQPVVITRAKYKWEWSPKDDGFRLFDSRGRLITTGLVQPRVLVKKVGGDTTQSSAGTVSQIDLNNNRLKIRYGRVNGSAQLAVAWRFDEEILWLEPVSYETSDAHHIVSLHYFADDGDNVYPSLRHSFSVVPGISESSDLSPIFPTWSISVDLKWWLGHGDGNSSVFQQWGLPTHYFCGATSDSSPNAAGSLKEHLSDAFCCGLAGLPPADLFFHAGHSACGPVLNIRSDYWGQATGPGRFELGSPFVWAIGSNYYDAIREYYRAIVREGIVQKKINSAAKNAIVTAPGFDTWGAEVAARKSWAEFDQTVLDSTYEGLKQAGMKSAVFMIDAKWEEEYGLLQHSSRRFPDFEEFLENVRADGLKLGMWAAFLRCNEPKSLGLESRHMLRDTSGKPLKKQENGKSYYLLDVTQPEVESVLAQLAKRFVRSYKPDLVKFDFGYELPSLSGGAPKDLSLAGERLLQKAVQIVVSAMREVNPDLVVMYYSLSPLFTEYFDIHSIDDLFMCADDYSSEANRRIFFSGLLGEVGIPTYGSSGYDWLSVEDIWFDTAAAGTLGSLNSFSGDEQNSHPTPERVAKYNGLAQLTRRTNIFTIEPLDPVLPGSVSGAHSSSWVRHENGEPVLIALRSQGINGKPGPGRYRDLMEANSSLVVASRTSESLMTSRKLGLVPYGQGQMLLRHDGPASQAVVTQHCFRAANRTSRTSALENGALRLPFSEKLEDGSLVEWVEINLS